MKIQVKDTLTPYLISLLFLVILEIISSSLFPIVGLRDYVFPFHILLVLYMGFKIETPVISLLVFGVEFIHHAFSIEGWEVGTLAGISVCIIISYLREIIRLNSFFMTLIITQLFQVLWFSLVSLLLYLKTHDIEFLIGRFWRFIPESLFLSVCAPFLFSLLDVVWKSRTDSLVGDEV